MERTMVFRRVFDTLDAAREANGRGIVRCLRVQRFRKRKDLASFQIANGGERSARNVRRGEVGFEPRTFG